MTMNYLMQIVLSSYYKWLVSKHPNSQQGELAQKRLESLDVE